MCITHSPGKRDQTVVRRLRTHEREASESTLKGSEGAGRESKKSAFFII